jgi:hypothetical protein
MAIDGPMGTHPVRKATCSKDMEELYKVFQLLATEDRRIPRRIKTITKSRKVGIYFNVIL